MENNIKWQQFGMVLLHTTDKDGLTSIKEDSLQGKCTSLLDLWKKRTSEPEWEQVAEALKEIDLNNLATKLKKAIVIKQPKDGDGHTHPYQAGEQVLKLWCVA